MAYVIKQTYKAYNHVVNEYSDPRSSDLFLASSPLPVIVILVGYLYFTCNIGPRLMHDRKGFNLKPIIILYNSLQIAANAGLLVYGGYWTYWQDDYSIVCTPYSPRTNLSRRGQMEVFVTYAFYMLKVSDLLDTIFFVLRKQTRHISFLHVYHHTGMVIASYVATRLFPAGHGAFLGVVNCFVHMCMYSYYLCVAMCCASEKRIWWKKYVTQIQMCALNPSCTYPKWICLIMGVQNLFIMCMFTDFYIKAYMTKKPSNKSL